MADIRDEITKIRTATYGREVRGSLADGLEAVNNEQIALSDSVDKKVKDIDSKVDQNAKDLNDKLDTNNDALNKKMDDLDETLTKRQDELSNENKALDEKFEDLIKNATVDDPSSVEIVAARASGNTGVHYETLGKRLDHDELAAKDYTDEQITDRVKGFVASVNGKKGDVVLTNKDVDAPTVSDVNALVVGLKTDIANIDTELKTNYVPKGDWGEGYQAQLQNGWYVEAGSEYRGLRYEKDLSGRVYIHGSCKGGKVGSGITIFTLPLGFRPLATEVLGAVPRPTTIQTVSLDVKRDGRVMLYASGLPDGNFITLHFYAGLGFIAENYAEQEG